MSNDRLSKFIEALRRAYPTDSPRPEDWHPEDQGLYYDGNFSSTEERHHAIFEARLRRLAEAAMAVAGDPDTPPPKDITPIHVSGPLEPDYIVYTDEYQPMGGDILEMGQTVLVTDGSGRVVKAVVTGRASFSGAYYFRVTHDTPRSTDEES